MSDRDDVTPDEYIKKVGECCYQLPFYDRQSINEIESTIERNKYKDRDTAEQHLTYLEHLQGKLRSILAEEKRSGLSNPELEADLRKVDQVFRKLYMLKSKLPESSSFY